MRAEDVNVGAWVRWSGDGVASPYDRPWKVGRVYDDGRIEGTAVDDVVCTADLDIAQLAYAKLEPWTPRVGDWVRFTDHPTRDPWQVRGIDGVGYARGWVDSKNLACAGRFDCIEPCAPPEAKPASAFIDELTAETRKACAEVSKALSAVIFEAASESIDALEPPKPIAPRDHNATCAKCGGRAYQGIGAVRCVEPVCDDPRTRMPEHVRRVTRRGERVWSAEGRGVLASHPLKEGAIAAWRAACATMKTTRDA